VITEASVSVLEAWAPFG